MQASLVIDDMPFHVLAALLTLIGWMLLLTISFRVSSVFHLLASIDLIYLRLLTNYAAPCSTYLFRNGEAALEILVGGTGITKFIGG